MPLSIPCPQCKKAIGLSRTTLGKMIKCPSCGRSFVAGGDDDEEPKELVAPITPPSAPATSSAPPLRKARPAVRKKQAALRTLVFLAGLAGAAGAGLLAAQFLSQVRPELGIPALDFEPLNPYVKAASLENETLHVRTITAYVLAGAAALGVLGSLLALGGPGLVPMFFFLAAFAAPLILNDRALPFTIPFIVAGVMSIALKAPGRRSALRMLLQVVGGVSAGALIMIAFMTKVQPPPPAPAVPAAQPGNSQNPGVE